MVAATTSAAATAAANAAATIVSIDATATAAASAAWGCLYTAGSAFPATAAGWSSSTPPLLRRLRAFSSQERGALRGPPTFWRYLFIKCLDIPRV